MCVYECVCMYACLHVCMFASPPRVHACVLRLNVLAACPHVTWHVLGRQHVAHALKHHVWI